MIQWYHPLVVFGIPLFVLLCGPVIYNLVAPYPVRPINESQIHEVASLLDDIYTTLINMTFIPATAIKRGPHKINSTAIPCKRDPAVLRLMEIMPYIDSIEAKEKDDIYTTDWLYGGEFIDYRHSHHLIDGCDPIRAEGTWFDMAPSFVALTSWGSGGWNGDQTHVLIYDTARNAIRLYDGEEWMNLYDEDDAGYDHYDYSGIGLLNHSVTKTLATSRDGWEWKTWFDAPTLLRRMLGAYQSLAWTPWETSNREEGWGVDNDVIKKLLRKNGWPHSLDADQFNADFIRARHVPSGRGAAEEAFKTIEELEGNSQEKDSFHGNGRITHTKDKIERLERSIREEKDEEARWYWVFRAQSDRWNLERDEADLAAAKMEVERLCPDGVCVEDQDLILWQFYSLEKEYKKSQRESPPEKICEGHLIDTVEFAPFSERYNNCVTRRRHEAHWLHLAYTQSKADALQRGVLLPQPSLQDRARVEIDKMERQILRAKTQALTMYEWLPTLPKNAEWARTEFEKQASAMANWPWNLRAAIEWYEEQLTEEGDKWRLERCLDDGSCVWGEV
jgi:hypothetical protein